MQTSPAVDRPSSRLPDDQETSSFLSRTVLAPDRSLLTYYLLSTLPLGPFFFVAFLPLYFRFRSTRYEVDEEGITMRWGVLFHREISLTYSRIQDIHLSSNVVERWLGLAKIQVQTASGSASAEMTIHGLHEYEQLRNFLYERMRGSRDPRGAAVATGDLPPGAVGELVETLREVVQEIRALRESLPPSTSGRDYD